MIVKVGGIIFKGVAKVDFFQVDLSEKIRVEIEYEDGVLDSIDVTYINAVHIKNDLYCDN